MSEDKQLTDLPQPSHEGRVSPDDLHVDGDNPNEMTDEQFGLLCDRMRENGWLGGPIITDTDGLIADGEHRWRAAKENDLAEVPVRQYDIDDATRRLWRQELNKIHGEHDRKRDALEYDYLLDAGKTEEVTALTEAADEDLDELLAEIRIDGSRPAAYDYDPEHNVHFEDCVEGMRERLEDDSVDCVITDPPYGIGATFSANDKGMIEGDETLAEALELLDDVLTECKRVVKPDGHLYIFWTPKHLPDGISRVERHYDLQNVCVWSKNRSNVKAALGAARYANKWEPVFFLTDDEPRLLAGRDVDNVDVFEAPVVHKDNRHHQNEKPLDLIEKFVTNSTHEGDTVLDPFMGSGTTAVAAIQNDRDYVGFEIDAENYREVIERRIGEAKRQREATVNADD